jgi:hypothetical protein
VKTVDRHGPAFLFFYEKFPRLSTEKIKAGVLLAPRYFQLFRKPQFGLTPIDDKQADQNAFQNVATDFLGNIKAINSWKLVEDIITFYELSCNVSLDTFPPLTLKFLFG